MPSHAYETRIRDEPRSYVTRTTHAESAIRFKIPELIENLPTCITEKISTHSIQGLSNYAKNYFLNQYEESCSLLDCYVCNRSQSTPDS